MKTITKRLGIILMVLGLLVLFTSCPDGKQGTSDEDAVKQDLSKIAIDYAAGDSASSVTQNISLPTSGDNGSSITWVSDNSAVVVDGKTGTVTRKEYKYPNSDVQVTMTATVKKGIVAKTKTIVITVKGTEPSETDTIDDIKVHIADFITYADGDSQTEVRENIGLQTSFHSATIVWTSGDDTEDENGAIVISEGTGTVTRPANTAGNQDITLTATISIGGEVKDSQTIDLTVKRELTDEQAVDEDLNDLDDIITDKNGDTVITNEENEIVLPTDTPNGCDIINWVADPTGWISTEEATLGNILKRPEFSHTEDTDQDVALTATIKRGNVEKTAAPITITIKEKDPTDQQAVDAVAGEVKVAYSSTDYTDGQTITAVTGNVTLSPGVGTDSYSYGTTIEWASSDDNASDNNGAVVVSSTTGTVTRPVWDVSRTSGYEEITLTATVSKDGATATKTITLQVTQADATTVESGAIGGVTAPVGGATAATSVTATSGYTGTIEWDPADSTFAAKQVYEATVSLTAKPGYSFDSTSSSGWTIGGESASYSKTDSTHAVVSVTFPETDSDAKEITSFSFTAAGNAALSADVTGTLVSNTVSISVPWGTDVTNLSPTIAVSPEATISPTSGTAKDFTNDVTYTVTAEDGSTKTWTVTVGFNAITDDVAVTEAMNNLQALGDAAISYASGDDKNSVTQNIDLATTSDFENYGTTISWSSNAPSYISNDNNGTVTRPAFNHSSVDDQTVTLTAKISKGTEEASTTFTLTVIEAEPTDQQAVNAVWGDFNSLASKITYASGDSANSVTQGLTLVTSTDDEMYGCTITWSSTDTSVVEANGTVHRPVYLDGDKAATLSVTVTKNTTTNGPNEIETVTVLKAAMTDDVAVSLAKEALVAADISYAAGDSAASVTQNITLPTSGENGTTISWGSSNTGAISTSGSTGSVTRPDCGSGNATVTLTATISKGAESDTKTFSVTVIEKEPVDVTISAIEGIDIPIVGQTPVTTITATSQYTGTVSWSPSVNTFQSSTLYTATVSLTCTTGYIYTNLASNFFTVAGATSVSFDNSTGVITAEFPNTTPETKWAQAASSGDDHNAFYDVAIDGSDNIFAHGFLYGDGDFTFGSHTLTGGSSAQSFLLVKYNSSGVAQWVRGSTHSNYGGIPSAVAADSAGNSYIGGYRYGSDTVTFDSVSLNSMGVSYNVYYIVKYNASGTAQWAKQPSSSPNASILNALAADDENVYVGGYYIDTVRIGTTTLSKRNNYTNGMNPFVAKYNSDGGVEWAKGLDSNTNSEGVSVESIAVDSNGNVYASGYFEDAYTIQFGSHSVTGKKDRNAFLVKFDENVIAQWLKTFESVDSTDDGAQYFNSVCVDENDNIFVSGMITGSGEYDLGNGCTISSTYAYHSAIVARFSADGTPQWLKLFTSTDQSCRFENIAVKGGLVYATGKLDRASDFTSGGVTVNGTNGNFSAPVMVCYSTSGTALWGKTATATPYGKSCFSGVVAGNNGIYATGYTENNNNTIDFGDDVTCTLPVSSKMNGFVVKYQ